MAEILHFVQNDRRRVQNDKHGISLIATQSPRGEGRPFIPQQSWGVFWNILIKTNTNSLFFQGNEGVNHLGLREGFEGRERTTSPGKVKKGPC